MSVDPPAGRTAVESGSCAAREGIDGVFLKGVAISMWQNSGDDDSNWTRFTRRTKCCGLRSVIDDGSVDRFPDFWNSYERDIILTKQLGCNCFRFSFEWARVEPSKGHIDRSAIDRYHAILDCLQRHALQPVATLHHFVHPGWFEDLGAFTKGDNIIHFVNFAKLIFEEFSKRIIHWATFNEPTVSMFCGYLAGVHPPGRFLAFTTGGVYLKNMLKAHVNAYEVMKALPGGHDALIGLVHHHITYKARRNWMIYWHAKSAAKWMQHWWGWDVVFDFMMTGDFKWRVPFRGVRVTYKNPGGRPPCDWWGINYYTRGVIGLRLNSTKDPGEVMTDASYPLCPSGLYKSIEKYSALKIPIYITETGAADKDAQDYRRQQMIRGYTDQVVQALKDGYDVRGFMYWTLVDNFEWNLGYTARFGLYQWEPDGSVDRELRDGSKVLRYVYQMWPSDLEAMKEYAQKMEKFEEDRAEGEVVERGAWTRWRKAVFG